MVNYMTEAFTVEQDQDGQCFLQSTYWPYKVSFDKEFLKLAMQGDLTPWIKLNGRNVIITLRNADAWYVLQRDPSTFEFTQTDNMNLFFEADLEIGAVIGQKD